MPRFIVSEATSCKLTAELTVPVPDVDAETQRVISEIRKKVKLPGFRPGKAPSSIIESRFESEIRHDVLEALIPKAFQKHAENENLRVISTLNVTDVHFHRGEPLKFKVEFEIFPSFELGEYRDLTVPYAEPAINDDDIAKRLDEIRDQKAEYVNVDPRPAAEGDHAVVALRSISGVDGPPVEQDEMMIEVGGAESLAEFTTNLLGMTPGDEKDFDVAYPESYGSPRLAGRTVRFHLTLKGLRRKELPELNDEFAADVGDFKTLEELREQVRRDLFREREAVAMQQAKAKLVETLVDNHSFEVPETFVDRQIQADLEGNLRELAAQGVDPRKLNIDWHELKKSQQERATREVKATLLLDKIAEREAIETLTDEVDREIHRISKQVREPAAAVRMRLEKDGTVRRIATRIRTDKVLNFLFENARKVAPE
jgi:trigger factor